MLAAFIDKTYVRPRAAVLRCSTQGENEKKTGERIFVYSFPKFVVKFRIGEEPAKIDAEGNEARERNDLSDTGGWFHRRGQTTRRATTSAQVEGVKRAT